jgi:hypothetical protein
MARPGYTDTDFTKSTATTHWIMAVGLDASSGRSARRRWNTAPPAARTRQLDISAPMPGTDFHAQFIVPVQD